MRIGMVSLLCATFCSVSLLHTVAHAGESDQLLFSEGSVSMSAPNLADQNQIQGEAYLAKNKTSPGVVTLPDGLQYKVIKSGEGQQPKDGDAVTVNYAGTFIDGKEFDSSYKRGEPATFPVNGVIQGWTEALKLMKAGSVWELYIPAKLAYGTRGAPPTIGPNQTLIFKVELISVQQG